MESALVIVHSCVLTRHIAVYHILVNAVVAMLPELRHDGRPQVLVS